MPKAYLRNSTIDDIASQAAYHEYPAASETGMNADDIAWMNVYRQTRAELLETYRDGVALPPGGYPGPGLVGLKNGLSFFCDGRDWYVDPNAAAIEKVDAGALLILGGRQ